MQSILQINHISHFFGDHQAINDLSFEVFQGEVLGLLGPNGAGKTTSIRLINGLFAPSSGEIRVLDMDPTQQGSLIRQYTGVLTESPALYERLTARQNLVFFGHMQDMEKGHLQHRIEEMLAFFDLKERGNEQVSHYSKGMKQRLALARALLNQPPLLFLDEPTSGLDPEAARQVNNIIQSVCRQNGQTVVICTHNLHEAETLCDRVAIINHGRLLAMGSVAELCHQYAPNLHVVIKLWQSSIETALNLLQSMPGVLSVSPLSNQEIEVNVAEESFIPPVINLLAGHSIPIYSVQPRQISLETIYFDLQNRSNGGV